MPETSNLAIRPILELFAAQLRHPDVGAILKDWRGALAKGALHFGRREQLDRDLDFNTLIYTDLHPRPTKNGKQLTLEPTLELVGVVSSKKLAHAKFRYMRNEMVIVRVTGRWDYARNDGPYDLEIVRDVTVRLPKSAGSAASKNVLRDVARLCVSRLAVKRGPRKARRTR